ncbi:hypothetical protein TNIN_240661 [Trichonephila inaurata madagascariensis]|uniref:Peptidase aspartic putative domain-containing protein n=1 Tax=Trichonephila inaurata madagascariensis TaxID=2747483 RepID=A0A8X6IT00_9ARAC|nr:hypothetical protein TNIN_240661 [Trichonephila inaurata madagascariensis]
MKLIEGLIEEGDSGYRNFVIPTISENVVRLIGRHYMWKVTLQENTNQHENMLYANLKAIDVLVGSDLFWELILPERIPIEKGMIVINAVLGWDLMDCVGVSQTVPKILRM